MRRNIIKLAFGILLILLNLNSFSQETEKITIFRNVNLVPMTQDTIIANQTVVIQGTRIRHIGSNNSIEIPYGSNVIDGTGKYLMPGLADMHAHYYSDYTSTSLFNLFIKNGVTTVRFFQSEPNDSIIQWSEKIKKHEIFGPTLFTCGLFFHVDDIYKLLTPTSISITKKNYDFIKIYGSLSKKEFKSTMLIAKKEHVYSIGHIPFLVGLDYFIKEGVNEIAHLTELDWELVRYPKLKPLRSIMFPIVLNNWVKDFYSYPSAEAYLLKKEKKIDKIVAKVKKGGLSVNTTLVVDKILIEQLYEKEKFLSRPELSYMSKDFMPDYLAGKNTYEKTVDRLMKKHKKIVKGDNGSKFFKMYIDLHKMMAKKMYNAGVPLLLGTDCPVGAIAVVPGYTVLEELQVLTDCGLTPYEAIKTGTTNAGIAAKAMTGVNDIGTIELNKQADLILTSKNPLQNVANVKEMTGVMVQGQWFPKEELDAMQVLVKTNLVDALSAEIYKEGGIVEARKRYEKIKADSMQFYSIKSEYLNNLGYRLLRKNMFNESIEIFKILVQEFPESEWFDSLAEAYMKAGNRELAILNYKKSLKLDPKSKSGKRALRKLKKK